MMANTLEQILYTRLNSVEESKRRLPLAEIIKAVQDGRHSPERSLRGALSDLHNTNIIAEIKRRSPSKGELRPDLNPPEWAAQYVQNGAVAISVLTEENHFGGSLTDLQNVRSVVDCPILRKDFMLDEYQIWESKLCGADAILLIAAALTDAQLLHFSSLAAELNLEVLFEVHNREECERIIPLQPALIGVNNRNLKDFTVSLNVAYDLIADYRDSLPGGLWVAESGIQVREQILNLIDAGYSGFLIGESIVTAASPFTLLGKLAGRI